MPRIVFLKARQAKGACFPVASIQYHKLVRDKIPEIIASTGKACKFRTLAENEYLPLLHEKLQEELNEYLQSGELEELADLLEVIQAVCVARGSSIDEVESLRRQKAEKRGGFEKKLLLTEVISPD